MDNFVTVLKPSFGRVQSDQHKNHSADKFAPYYKILDPHRAKRRDNQDKFLAPLLKDGTAPSSAAITKHLLSTLSDELNPITHSDSKYRADHVTSAVTGHQRSEVRLDRSAYLKHRAIKLEEQKQGQQECGVLADVRLYVNGYLNDTTDIEMKRLVTLAGGEVLQSASGATHIVTSQQLNGSKTHKILTAKGRVKVHVVRPEWVMDSIKTGKRKPERDYHIVKPLNTLDAFLQRKRAVDCVVG